MKAPVKSSIVTRCAAIIDVLSASPGPLGLGALVSQTGLAKSSPHRLLSILQGEGLVEFDDRQNGYRLGPRLRGWARQAWESADLEKYAAEPMKQLSELTGNNVALAILDNAETLYLKTVEQYVVRYAPKMGERAPIHCTAVGKVLVAYMPEPDRTELVESLSIDQHTPHTVVDKISFVDQLNQVSRDGYARNDGEEFVNIVGLAAPIFDHESRVIASLCLWGLRDRMKTNPRDGWSDHVRQTAAAISAHLGFDAA